MACLQNEAVIIACSLCLIHYYYSAGRPFAYGPTMKSTLAGLPNNVLIYFYSLLLRSDIRNVCLTCKSLHEAAVVVKKTKYSETGDVSASEWAMLDAATGLKIYLPARAMRSSSARLNTLAALKRTFQHLPARICRIHIRADGHFDLEDTDAIGKALLRSPCITTLKHLQLQLGETRWELLASLPSLESATVQWLTLPHGATTPIHLRRLAVCDSLALPDSCVTFRKLLPKMTHLVAGALNCTMSALAEAVVEHPELQHLEVRDSWQGLAWSDKHRDAKYLVALLKERMPALGRIVVGNSHWYPKPKTSLNTADQLAAGNA
jgi:hypothetical protein